MKLQTELIVDSSPVGLGAILTQTTNEGEICVVAYASKRLIGAESRYSHTEREALAVVWASEHFYLYLFGTEYKVITAHMLLLAMMNNPISKPTASLERLCMRLQPYKMKVQYRPGRLNTADYLSRHPNISAKENHKSWIDIQIEYAYVNAIQVYEADGLSCEMIRDSTSSNSLMQELIDAIITQRWHNRIE